jgi:type IV pilus assembly protein PilE
MGRVMLVRSRKVSGFTLIEVMVTVAVVGILAAIAFPNYTAYVQRSKIVDGVTKMGDFRSQLEKFFLDNRRYPTVAGGAICGPMPLWLVTSADKFTITCNTPSDITYLIRADGIPAEGMAGFAYTVDQAGVKTTVALPPNWKFTVGCWVVRKDGAC